MLRLDRLKLTAWMFAASLLLLVSRTNATTCASNIYTLAELYERSAGIVHSQVIGCAQDASAEDGRCPDDLYRVQTIDVLKEPNPWQDFSGEYKGGITCGMRYQLGETYLLFFDEARRLNSTGSRATNQNQSNIFVETLRAYRDGKIEDLSEPWSVRDDGRSCSLEQVIFRQSISFSYFDKDAWPEPKQQISYDENGNARLTISPLVQQTPMGLFETEVEMPLIDPSELTFYVRFDPHLKTEPDTGVISIGDQTWSLQTQKITVRRDGEPFQLLERDFAHGADAEEIFQAMLESSDITLKKLAGAPVQRGEDSRFYSRAGAALIETRSTQFGARAPLFSACVDRVKR